VRKAIILILVVMLVGGGLVCGCCLTGKDKIVIGQAVSLTGPSAFMYGMAAKPVQEMWIDEVNAAGGIYVEEYGKKLPVELRIYDDTSDMATMVRLVEKLIVEDKVDLLFPPCGTGFVQAAAPIFNNYEYIMLVAEDGATTITDTMLSLPYFFGILNYPERYQMQVLADIFTEVGVKSVAIIYSDDLYGLEYYNTASTEFTLAGIDIVMGEAVPVFTTDVEPVLKQAKDSGADAFCVFVYPPQDFLIVETATAIGYNPKAFLIGAGGCSATFPETFGPAAEGVMCLGAWNCQSSPEVAEFCDKYIARYGDEGMDQWGGLLRWAGWHWVGLQCLEQAIVEAGTLDQSVIKEVMATSTFDTILGPSWFDQFDQGGYLLASECYPGYVGQWQSGSLEVIDPGANRTADPIYPRP
jgi:branched-chain amino acid transport system substrate-binding protein